VLVGWSKDGAEHADNYRLKPDVGAHKRPKDAKEAE
jgi:hypothetical protein